MLLGEMLRVHLPKLVLRVNGDRLSEYSPLSELDEIPEHYRPPAAHAADPLRGADQDDVDDPCHQYRRGVLSRDGGHFIAAFPDGETAARFRDEAETLLAREVSGLRFDISIDPGGLRADRPSRHLVDLPQFQVCEESGRGPATQQRKTGGSGASNPPWVSRRAEVRKDAGDRFYRRKERTRDMIGLLQDHFSKYGQPPQDFQDLCAGGYLAVIRADGNDIGKRYNDHMERFGTTEDLTPDAMWLAKEAYGERFYWSMRVCTRRALITALDETFQPQSASTTRPFQLLMVGGDDLLLACRADAALRFVINYAAALRHLSADDATMWTVGAGVVISRPNVPFHHLYQIAEALTKSGKRLHRGLPDTQKASVVDWMVSTTAWVDNPIAQRQRDCLIRAEVNGAIETLALTRRPCRILAKVSAPYLDSLEGLSEVATRLSAALTEGRIARSQLRDLVDGLARGRRASALLFDELPRDLRHELGQRGVTKPWEAVGDGSWVTSLADLVELVEISRLGRKHTNSAEEAGTVR